MSVGADGLGAIAGLPGAGGCGDGGLDGSGDGLGGGGGLPAGGDGLGGGGDALLQLPPHERPVEAGQSFQKQQSQSEQ